jgi:hypothetical protein
MKSIFVSLLFYTIFLCSENEAVAQIPRTISYQGVLANPDGTLIKDGNHNLVLSLYLASTSGSSIYTEIQSVPVVRGIFNIIIGSVTALPLILTFDRAYFLGVSVDGGSELSPRTALTAVPYALYAARAAIADGLSPNATGVVTSINEEAGALRLIGAGGTTVSNAGTVFTISSTTGGGGTGFKLPYSDSAANGAKPIFNVANTAANGNTISGVGAHGSGIGGMTTSALFGDGGIGYNGVSGFSNGGSNAFAGVTGRGIGNANGILAISTNGDGINATSSSSHAGFFQSAGNVNTLEALNNGNGEAIKGTSTIVGVHGLSSGATGVMGETQSAAGIGVDARYSGAGSGTALQLFNGAIKVSGASRAAFVHTATPLNIWGAYNAATEINNPLCNGDSTAMVFITHSAPPSATLPTFVSWWHIVYYDTSRQKWQIYAPGAPGIGIGDQFFVLIIKR